VLLTVIRLIHGIGVGGEWGGSVLLAMEWAQTNKNPEQHRTGKFISQTGSFLSAQTGNLPLIRELSGNS
jgi:MFS family permease